MTYWVKKRIVGMSIFFYPMKGLEKLRETPFSFHRDAEKFIEEWRIKHG